jgi:hypothetical protein
MLVIPHTIYEQGIISQDHNITVSLDAVRINSEFTPVIGVSHGGAWISPKPETRTFNTGPVIYTVHAEDGTTQDYTVTVNWQGNGPLLISNPVNLAGYGIEPRDGQAPNPGNFHVAGGHFTIGQIIWRDQWNALVQYDEYFDTTNRQYTATFTLTADEGYQFTNYPSVANNLESTDSIGVLNFYDDGKKVDVEIIFFQYDA